MDLTKKISNLNKIYNFSDNKLFENIMHQLKRFMDQKISMIFFGNTSSAKTTLLNDLYTEMLI